jgi:hypothetical protein
MKGIEKMPSIIYNLRRVALFKGYPSNVGSVGNT